MFSHSQLTIVIEDTKRVKEALGIANVTDGDRIATGLIAASLIMSASMQTVSDVGPAVSELAAALPDIAKAIESSAG